MGVCVYNAGREGARRRLGDLSWLPPREAVEWWEPPGSSMESLASQSDPGVCWVSCSAFQGFCQRQGDFDKEMWLKKLNVRRRCTKRT